MQFDGRLMHGMYANAHFETLSLMQVHIDLAEGKNTSVLNYLDNSASNNKHLLNTVLNELDY